MKKYGGEHRSSVLECARVFGQVAAVPDSFVPFLAPRVSGDLEVLPGGIDADQRADVTDLLGAMITGAKVLPLPHFAPLSEVLTDPNLVGTTSPHLRDSALSACAALAHVVASSKDALAAAFVATGRLESLEAALLSLLRAILAWRGGGASTTLADKAFSTYQKRAATKASGHYAKAPCALRCG